MGVSRRAIEEKPGRQSGREEEGIGVHRRVEQQEEGDWGTIKADR